MTDIPPIFGPQNLGGSGEPSGVDPTREMELPAQLTPSNKPSSTVQGPGPYYQRDLSSKYVIDVQAITFTNLRFPK